VLGKTVTVKSLRGRPLEAADGVAVLVTVHPSYLLRLPDEATKRHEYGAFVADLKIASARLGNGAHAPS
jgi:DNA polymerase